PKGVMIEHRNLYSYLMNFRPTIDANDRTLQSMSTTCDSSVAEIFPTLCSGATLVFWEKDLSATIKKEKITYTNLTPSMAELVNPQDCSSLKKLIIGGEKLKIEIVKKFPETVEIYNGYGPTEATVDATVTKMTISSNIHIGDTLPHVKIYVVGKEGQICQNGGPGELWIGGEGVARGYLNRPELTRDKFIKNPFGEGRLYKSGDLVCWKNNDNLDFLGRIDRQVKVRGFRVELDGLEKLISTYPGVTGVHVVLQGHNLITYLTPNNLDLSELKEFISKQVPSYAVPSMFIDMESFPINSAGKVDEKGLPAPKLSSIKKEDRPVTPEEKKLADIWRKILAPDMVEKDFPISTKDNFYDLGGNSLDVLKLTQKLQEEINPYFSLDQANANPGFLPMMSALLESEQDSAIEERASKIRVFIDSVKSLPSYTYDIFMHYGAFIILIVALILFPKLTLIMMGLEFLFHRFFKLPRISFFRRFILGISAPNKKYNSVKIIEEYPLEKIKRTAFMLTPHGVTEHHIRPVEQHMLKKGVNYRNTHHAFYFKVPFCRTWYQLNMGIPGKDESYFQAEKEDFSLMVALGDRETLRPDEAGFVDISGQKVFFKYILKTGTSLTPVYVHGNEKAFRPFNHFIKWKFDLYRKYDGLTFQPYWGRVLLPLPHKVDLKVTFGRPIEVEKVENPTWDQVETLYAEYIKCLKDLYRKHAPLEHPELKIY
ncbi:MAG: hypothetical protein DRQ88_11210, partial [Epsilonproteobacteria bacterium]